MCFNALSGDLKQGDTIALRPCSGQVSPDEQFEFYSSDNTIRVKSKPDMCFNALSGDLKQGDEIALWWCGSGTPNEQFEFHSSDNTIRVKSKPDMCFNALSGDLKQGDAIALWSCSGQTRNEQFAFTDCQTSTTPILVDRCWCKDHGTGTGSQGGKNGYECLDGTSGWCSSSHQKCVVPVAVEFPSSNGNFPKAELGSACKVMCGMQASGPWPKSDAWQCTDGTSGYCRVDTWAWNGIEVEKGTLPVCTAGRP
jgi:hypothetical protein